MSVGVDGRQNRSTLADQINYFVNRSKMSFVALDSANTLNPVQRLLNLTLDLFYACSTFDSIELKGPTVLIVRINILLSGMRSFYPLTLVSLTP